jgi:hypothetical protein
MVSKMNNKFDRLKAIAAGQAQATSFNPTITFWKYELNNPLIGTIKGFDGLKASMDSITPILVRKKPLLLS